MNTKELLNELTSVCGVSGYEKNVAETALSLLKKYCTETSRDNMGNVIGKINGCGNKNTKRKIMLEAHMDQVGFLVSDIDDNGYLKFTAVGGIDPRILPGLRVKILGTRVFGGVISVPEAVGEKNTEIKDMKIFTGIPKEELKELVSVGDHIVFDYELTELKCGNLCSGAMDNRSGMAAMLLALEKLNDKKIEDDIYVVFSTQEEVGLRGSYTGTYGIQPDLAIVVDVTHGTTVDSEKDAGVFDLGSGAIILRGPNVDYKKALSLIELAKENDIDYKIEAAGGASGTTAWAIQTVGRGVRTLLISIPLRYMHTNVEVLKSDDVNSVSSLVAAAVEYFSKQ